MSNFLSIVRIRTIKSPNKMKKFLDDEIQEILKYKWIRSEEACYDMGEQAIIEWIQLYAAEFRKEWEDKYGSIIDERECSPSSSGSYSNT